MMQLSSTNDDSSLCYDVFFTHQSNLRNDKFVIFRVISIKTIRQTYLEMLSSI